MGILLMLVSIGGVIAAAVLFLITLYTKRSWLMSFAAGGMMIWFAFYLAIFLGTSMTSREKTLGINEPKEFCGFYLDCHMHTAVTGVRKARTIGDATAKGEFYIVKVNVFSDAVRANLALNTVDAHVVDAEGREYTRDKAAESELGPQLAFETEIGPEESFDKEIVFDLPAGVEQPKLDIREGYGIDRWIEAVLIGDEDSIFHKRSYFDLRNADTLVRMSPQGEQSVDN